MNTCSIKNIDHCNGTYIKALKYTHDLATTIQDIAVQTPQIKMTMDNLISSWIKFLNRRLDDFGLQIRP